MSTTTTNMGLTSWSSPSDLFDNNELADNWTAVDQHDHTTGKGVQIPTAGIATNAVTSGKLANNAVTTAKIAAGAVTNAQIATGTILASNLGALPAVRAYNSAVVATTDSTLTPITLDSERFDTDTIHSTSSFTERLTCHTAGIYFIWGNVGYATSSVGYRQTSIRLNGASTIIARTTSNGIASVATEHTVSTLYSLAVNDYVGLYAYQTSGGALNVTQSVQFTPEFGMVRVG
jgi:hypothetical protein